MYATLTPERPAPRSVASLAAVMSCGRGIWRPSAAQSFRWMDAAALPVICW